MIGIAVFEALLLALAVGPLGTCSAQQADQPVAQVALSAEERAEGFVPLFDGHSLAGWEHNGPPGTFHVENGELVGRRIKGSAYWLSTKEQYGDFELRLQFKIEPGGNSGVFIRAPRHGRTSREGMEVQIIDDSHLRNAPNKGSMGAIYGVVAPKKQAAKPAGEWNDLWIRCVGDRITVTLNGVVVNDLSMTDYPPLRDRPRRGYIGLSAHTGTVRFRNIRIKVLDEKGKQTAQRP